MEKITASIKTLMRQAPMTTNEYLSAAIKEIDSNFGEGYAKTHPELIGAYIQTCAIDFAAASVTSALQELANVKA
jgi:hypothetical protein